MLTLINGGRAALERQLFEKLFRDPDAFNLADIECLKPKGQLSLVTASDTPSENSGPEENRERRPPLDELQGNTEA